jgi:hypothetical protein
MIGEEKKLLGEADYRVRLAFLEQLVAHLVLGFHKPNCALLCIARLRADTSRKNRSQGTRSPFWLVNSSWT